MRDEKCGKIETVAIFYNKNDNDYWSKFEKKLKKLY